MPYGLLADLTALAHLGFVVFVPVGGFVALRFPRVLLAHVPSVVWAFGIATIGWRCPLTDLENAFRERAGRSTHEVGFIDAYLTDVVYPERFLPVLQGLVAASVLVSYALLARQRRGTSTLAG